MTATSAAPAAASESQRLRTHRVRVSKIDLKPMSATATHVELGRVEGLVEDMSVYGMALRFENGRHLADGLLVGDRLTQLSVTCEGELVAIGGAGVRHVTVRDNDLLLGVAFESPGLDLGAFYSRGMRRTFAQRWAQRRAQADDDRLPPLFKGWILDLRDDLERMREFLTKEEEALQVEDDVTRKEMLRQYLGAAAPVVLERMNRASIDLISLTAGLDEEQHRACRALCRRMLGPLVAHSPFMRRALEKPLGYAGDYELMNMLYRDHAEGATLFGRLLNLYGTEETAGRAVLSRVEYMLGYLRTVAASSAARARIASIGCGPAREIELLLQQSPELGCKIDVALVDQEERSIRYCEKTLGPLAAGANARLECIREPIRRLLVARSLAATLGTRDLIYSAGLFDYLNDQAFAALLGALYDALAPGGLLLVGNMATHNPSRLAMEYFVDWFLIHRSVEQLHALTRTLNPRPASVAVETEPLGVNLFLVIRR
jgi:extracellular factor (EF) 3-hydroxypalmitic acid methyl ester biosynthesis protein